TRPVRPHSHSSVAAANGWVAKRRGKWWRRGKKLGQYSDPLCHHHETCTVLQILSVTFPFFALVLCGYVAARRRMLPLEAIPGLNGFVLFFALPCMLYRFGASTPLAQLFDAGVFGAYLLCALLM